MFFFFFLVVVCVGIDGLEDMKPICGIIVAEGKAKVEKEGKVIRLFFMLFLIFPRILF